MTYREIPDPPDLTSATVGVAGRAKDIEQRLHAAAARGEQPITSVLAVLAEALHSGASVLLFELEQIERSELAHARLIAAEHRLERLLERAERVCERIEALERQDAQ